MPTALALDYSRAKQQVHRVQRIMRGMRLLRCRIHSHSTRCSLGLLLACTAAGVGCCLCVGGWCLCVRLIDFCACWVRIYRKTLRHMRSGPCVREERESEDLSPPFHLSFFSSPHLPTCYPCLMSPPRELPRKQKTLFCTKKSFQHLEQRSVHTARQSVVKIAYSHLNISVNPLSALPAGVFSARNALRKWLGRHAE